MVMGIAEQIAEQDENWRTRVPARFRGLPDEITTIDIAEMFGYTTVYVRRLRQARVHADENGDTGPLDSALPRALGVFRRPLFWRTEDVVQWGMQTGRLDPKTGKARRLCSSGRKPSAART
jgi:hypothetical protein